MTSRLGIDPTRRPCDKALMISRRAILAGSATGLAAMPLLAQGSGMIDLGLPGGPGQRPQHSRNARP